MAHHLTRMPVDEARGALTERVGYIGKQRFVCPPESADGAEIVVRSEGDTDLAAQASTGDRDGSASNYWFVPHHVETKHEAPEPKEGEEREDPTYSVEERVWSGCTFKGCPPHVKLAMADALRTEALADIAASPKYSTPRTVDPGEGAAETPIS